VVFQATDLTFGSDPKAIIPWVVKATENMLVAAASQPQVKRFVLTSSSTAAVIPVADKLNVRVGEGKTVLETIRWKRNKMITLYH